MSHNIFFIGGIHGVGKTTLCTNFSKELYIPIYTASEIINKSIRDKKIIYKEICDNQKLLIEGLSVISKSTDIILDGHFVLLGHKNEAIKIPMKTFKDINPKVMFVLTDTPREIYKRLLKRDNRDYSLEALEKLQIEEISHANMVSKVLNIPLYVLDINENNKIVDILKNYMEDK